MLRSFLIPTHANNLVSKSSLYIKLFNSEKSEIYRLYIINSYYFGKLRNSMDRELYQKEDENHYLYKNINNPIYNGPILWTKVHMGWQNILSHDWGYDKHFEIPDVSDMKWTDVLDTKVMVMN